MRTYVYIDGFNFYYGAVRNTPYKWVDFSKLCLKLLPRHDIQRMKYFTARVANRPSDPNQATRQQTYLRALRTIPNMEIVFGHFLTNEVRMPVVNPLPGQPKTALVLKTEEKGSDVNMATHLLVDAFNRRFDAAVLITNDSDLTEPLRIVKEELSLKVGVLNPHRKPSRELIRVASFVKPIRRGAVKASQFPLTLSDTSGTFTKPANWY